MGETISVAMVTFNGERFIRPQLESIIRQDPQPAEIVIGDDGSTDGTIESIKSLISASSIPVRLIQGEHVGLRGNVERTLAICEGDVIALADQDDIWMPGKVLAIRTAFERPDVTMWFSDALLVDDDDRDLGRRLWEVVSLDEDALVAFEDGQALRRLIHGQTVTGATMAFRSSLREAVMPLPARLEYGGHLYLHDGWIAILASLLGRVIADPVSYTRYRQHPGQVTYQHGLEYLANAQARAGSRLASRAALEVERDRVALVLDRLEKTGLIARCRTADVDTLRDLRALLDTRTMSAGPSKWVAVAGELFAGRYSQYSRGWRTAAADVFTVRDVT